MAKKVLSFFLAAMLIMSVLSVSAATEANPATIYTDGFETGSVAADGTYTSDVWNLTNAASEASAGKYSGATVNADLAFVEQGSAPDVNRVLEVNRVASGGFHMSMSTANVEIPSDQAVYAGFKVMFTGYPSAAKQWLIGVGRNPLIKIAPGYENYAVTETRGSWSSLDENNDTKQAVRYNTWITVMMKITATTAQAWVYDAEGLILTTTEKSGSFKGYPSIFHPNEAGANNVKMYIDDSFYALVDTNNTISLQSSSLADNATNVALTNQNIDLKFDMPVGDLADGDITCGDATVVAEKIAYDTVRVNLSGVEEETNYTLDFSGVKGMSENSLCGTDTISFTTIAKPANPATVYTDNFDTVAVASNGSYTSDVWAMTDSVAETSAGKYSGATVNTTLTRVASATDANDYILEVSRASSTGGFHLPMTIANASIPEGKVIYASVKLTLPQFPGSAKQWLIGVGRNPLVKVLTGQEKMVISETQGSWNTQQEVEATKQQVSYNSWVTVLMKISSTTAQAWVYNEAGEQILATTAKTGTFNGYPSIFHPNESGGNNVKMYIADSMYALVGADNTVAMTSSSVAAGATNVELLDQSIDMKFQLPLADTAINGITLNGTAVTAKKVGYDTIRVTLPAVLAPSTDYTLNFAGVSGLAGNALYGAKALTFTTKAYADDFIVKNFGGLFANGGNDIPPAGRLTVANVGDAKEDVDFIVAFYSEAGKLIGAQWVTDVDFGAQATATVRLVDDGYVYRDVYGIRVFAFSSDSELKPLFSGATYGDLWD